VKLIIRYVCFLYCYTEFSLTAMCSKLWKSHFERNAGHRLRVACYA